MYRRFNWVFLDWTIRTVPVRTVQSHGAASLYVVVPRVAKVLASQKTFMVGKMYRRFNWVFLDWTIRTVPVRTVQSHGAASLYVLVPRLAMVLVSQKTFMVGKMYRRFNWLFWIEPSEQFRWGSERRCSFFVQYVLVLQIATALPTMMSVKFRHGMPVFYSPWR